MCNNSSRGHFYYAWNLAPLTISTGGLEDLLSRRVVLLEDLESWQRRSIFFVED